MRYARSPLGLGKQPAGAVPAPWDLLDDSACGELPPATAPFEEAPAGLGGPGMPEMAEGADAAFSFEESAIGFLVLTDEERDVAASSGAGDSGFHPILPPALPPSPDGDASVAGEDAASTAAAAPPAWEKALGRLRAHRWRAAACLALVAAAAAGGYAGYSAGHDAAVAESASAAAIAVDDEAVAADRAKRDANIAARYEAMGRDFAAADRVPADEIAPITVYPVEVEPSAEVQRVAAVDVSPGAVAVLDVPLVNQLDDSDGGRSLMAGCEVASLAMLLGYNGIETTKEELQDAAPTVPMVGEDGLYGNPNRAFVGEMDGDMQHVGYSIYHAPIADMAQRYLANRSFKAFDLTGQSFTTMLQEVASGNPCWVITTTSMAPDLMLETWQTAEGPVDINWALHSVVVTGFDDYNVFINDPYGYEPNIPYERTAFEQAWKLMGSQCVTIVPVG